MTQQEIDVYQYSIYILSVKMNVKFPCKMKLQYNGNPITSDVGSNESQKFIFNQQVTLKDQNEKSAFELTVSVITEKGGKYISGLIKVTCDQLNRSEGQCLTLPLVKCLDADASIQLRVDQVNVTKQARKVNYSGGLAKSKVQQGMTQFAVPKNRSRGMEQLGGTGHTKSQYNFPINVKKPRLQFDDNKTRYNPNLGQSMFQKNRSPGNKFLQISRDQPMQYKSMAGDREKLIQAQVYKEGYTKLKQKYKKQAQNAKNQLNKRMHLENSENNLKLQIMRVKLKTEEQQRTINQKNNKIKQLQTQLSNYQKKQLDLVYLKEQYSNKDHTIKMLQQELSKYKKENDEIKNELTDKLVKQQDRLKQLKYEMQLAKNRFENKQLEYEKQIRMKTQSIHMKDTQINSKNHLLDKQKKIVEDLEKDSQMKMLQYEKNLQTQKSASKSKIEQIKSKLLKLQKDKVKTDQTNQSLQQQLQKCKSYETKIQYQNKILIQQLESHKKELIIMREFKDKYSQTLRDLKLTTDDKNYLQKQLQKTMQNKQINISELNKQYNDQLEYYKKINREGQDKQKTFSNRMIQLQGQLQSHKATSQKLRRNIQTLNNELADYKQKQKVLKKTITNKQQQILSLQSDFSTNKQKNKSSEHFLKHQLEQYKQQLQRIRSEFEQQSMKNVQISEENSKLNVQLGKCRVKLQFMEEKTEKDAASLQQRKFQIQTLIKEQQMQTASLNETISSLRQVQKDLITKIQKQQIQLLKLQDKSDRSAKDNKIYEQKLSLLQNSLKSRHQQNSSLSGVRSDLQNRMRDMDDMVSSMKNEINTLNAQKNKNLKMIEIIQDENGKLKKQIEKHKHNIDNKEKEIQQHQLQIKKNKEDYVKLQMKLNSSNNDFLRFRQSIFQTLNSCFIQVIADGKKQLAGSQVIEAFSHPNKKVHDGSHASLSEVTNLITNYGKDSKLAINKLGEQLRASQRQCDKLNEQLTNIIAKSQNQQFSLNQNIQQLQQEIKNVYNQRDEDNIKFDIMFKDLNNKLREKERQVLEMTDQIEQLNYTVTTYKLQNQSQSEANSKKNQQFKRNIQQYEEKIDICTITITNLQEKIFSLENQRETIMSQLRDQKQNHTKTQRSYMESSEKNTYYEKIIEDGKRQRKDLIQRNTALQLQLNSERDNNSKYKQLLDDQQNKGTQLKTFINNLMKQKETAIKSELEKGQQIIQLQGSLLELNRDKDVLTQDNQRMKKQLDQNKQNIKKQLVNIKDLEIKNAQEKNKNQKLTEKLKEKEKQSLNRQQNIQKLQSKLNRLTQRSQKEVKQLHQQIQSKTNQIIALTKQHSDKSFNYEKEKQALDNKISYLKVQVANLEQQLSHMKQNNNGNVSDIQSLGSQLQGLKYTVNQLQIKNDHYVEQIRQKEELLFELQGRIYNLEIKIQSKEIEKNQRVDAVQNDWVYKYEGMCQQYQQRIELVEKQRDYFKIRLQDQQEQFKKLFNDKSMGEIEESKIKTILEQKIKKLQQQRLQLVTQKNIQIQKLSEDLKGQYDAAKIKQAQIRRVSHQLEVARSTITKLDNKSKQNEQKIKNLNKVYQAELEQLKKKEATYKNFKQAVSTMQWAAQRQVRKVVQNYNKKSLEICEDNRMTQKFVQSMKNFEQNIVDAMRINLQEVK